MEFGLASLRSCAPTTGSAMDSHLSAKITLSKSGLQNRLSSSKSWHPMAAATLLVHAACYADMFVLCSVTRMTLTIAWSSVSSHATACSLTANTRAQNSVVKSVVTARKRWDHSCSSVVISCKTRYATKRRIHRLSPAEPRSPASCPPASMSTRCSAGRTQRKSFATYLVG